jgi:PLP dependent protein
LLQVNTSGEDSKSGLAPLQDETSASSSELVSLAKHIVTSCPRLYLQGLMTIGSIEQSHQASEDGKNQDFETLKHTRDLLQQVLAEHSGKWGIEDRLVLSMGMSSDFEAALSAGSDIVRVGTGIFGARHKKGEA